MSDISNSSLMYLKNKNIRRITHLIIAVVIGVFSSWNCLFVLCAIFSISEFIFWSSSIYKYRFSISERLSSYEKGYVSGDAIGQAIALSIRTLVTITVIASIIKYLYVNYLLIL